MLDKTKIAEAINPFASSEAQNSQMNTLEIPVEEVQALLKELTDIYNLLAETISEEKLMGPRELAQATEKAMKSIKAEHHPISKLLLICAYIRQRFTHIKNGLKTRPFARVDERMAKPQAMTKIKLRALQLIDYVQQKVQGKEKALVSSTEARTYLAGQEGKPPSRRDTLRAFERATQIMPAIDLERVPNDLRGTRRLVLNKDSILSIDPDPEERTKSSHWQRSKMEEIRVIFFKEEGRPAIF
jgi:dsDNA-specific endonuclease/ATPase MutS2